MNARSRLAFGLKIFWAALRQRRLFELCAVSTYLEFKLRPSDVEPTYIDSKATARFLNEFQEVAGSIIIFPGGEAVRIRREAVCSVGSGILYGEYHPLKGTRVFLEEKRILYTFDFYENDHRVNHIHSIQKISDQTVLINYGDSRRYSDLVLVGDGEATLKRIGRYDVVLGGYTSGCWVRDRLYLGSDFTERKNFIQEYTTRVRHPLPRRICRHFVSGMYHIKGTACIKLFTNKNVHTGSDDHAVVTFCTKTNSFSNLRILKLDYV